MGKFFNEKVKNLHKIPESRDMERMRREFINEQTLCRQAEAKEGTSVTDGGNREEPVPDVLSTREKRKAGRPKLSG